MALLKERGTGSENAELTAAMQRIGQLSMENALLRARIGLPTLWSAGGRAGGRKFKPRRYRAPKSAARAAGAGNTQLTRELSAGVYRSDAVSLCDPKPKN